MVTKRSVATHFMPGDLVEWIGDTYAILSLAKAGDTWFDVMS